jgi:hypothetical protein
MNIDVPESGMNFTPHPVGPAEGIIAHVTDLGVEDKNPFDPAKDPRHRVIFRLQSFTLREDGSPYLVNIYSSISRWPTSGFVIVRNALAGRTLTPAELGTFDTNSVVGVRVTGIVTHKEKKGGGEPYAQVDPASLYRHKDQTIGEIWPDWDFETMDAKDLERMGAPRDVSFSSAGGQAQGGQPAAGSTGEDDLPF